jgi:hypothetical protein
MGKGAAPLVKQLGQERLVGGVLVFCFLVFFFFFMLWLDVTDRSSEVLSPDSCLVSSI